MSSPYHKLFGTPHNYFKLHVFGCLCYPRLRPYSLHKITPRSTPCVSLGYLLTQSSYICFNPSTTKTYHSRHIHFIESIFPLSTINPSLPRSNMSTISTWFSATLVYSTPPSTPSAANSTSNSEHLVFSGPPTIVDLPHARAPEPPLPHLTAHTLPLPTTLSRLPITTNLPLPHTPKPLIDLPPAPCLSYPSHCPNLPSSHSFLPQHPQTNKKLTFSA